MSKKIIKDELRFLLFTEIYQRFHEPKTRRMAFAILETAIAAFAKRGFWATSIDTIARQASVARSQVNYYHGDAIELRLTAMKYIRLSFQKFLVDQSSEEIADRMLSTYVQACFDWVQKFKVHAIVWADFVAFSTRDKKARELNAAAVRIGTERIRSIIQHSNKEYSFSDIDLDTKARLIQTLITGAMVSLLSEEIADLEAYQKTMLTECLNLARPRR